MWIRNISLSLLLSMKMWGAPWFDHMVVTMKLLDSYKDRYIVLDVNSACSTIPYVNDNAFDKVIKNYISCYMIFVKESKEGLSVLHVSKDETKEDL